MFWPRPTPGPPGSELCPAFEPVPFFPPLLYWRSALRFAATLCFDCPGSVSGAREVAYPIPKMCLPDKRISGSPPLSFRDDLLFSVLQSFPPLALSPPKISVVSSPICNGPHVTNVISLLMAVLRFPGRFPVLTPPPPIMSSVICLLSSDLNPPSTNGSKDLHPRMALFNADLSPLTQDSPAHSRALKNGRFSSFSISKINIKTLPVAFFIHSSAPAANRGTGY